MEKNNNSIWLNSIPEKEYKTLEYNLSTEVCVIGGGITGISTAYYLSKHGIDVTVLEKDKICSKTTGHTTGKITSQHGLFYKYLLDSHGKDYAKKYLDVNIKALENIGNIINEENIQCDFERRDSFVFTLMPERVKAIQEEVSITQSLGIKSEFVEEMMLPLKIHGGIKFESQAQFNPVKYVDGLCNCISKNGVKIYENSKATEYKRSGGKFKITVESDGIEFTVLADKIVVATRYPIFNFPGVYFIKNYQELEHAICVKVNENISNYDMYLSVDSPNISFRTVLQDGERYLLVVGNGRKSGKNCNKNGFEFLENTIKNMYSNYEIIDKWVAEDCISLDKIPYIGKYSNFSKNIYVATGFKKWGMTFSNVAANIITDEILNGSSKYSELFNSTRIKPIKNKEEMKNMLSETYNSLVKPKFLKGKNKKCCSHLGCKMEFNVTTDEWECPCHGSRFEKDGKLIDGPSTKNI